MYAIERLWIVKTDYYRCELEYPPRDARAATAFGYVARADEHAGHPDRLLHLESGNMPAWVNVHSGAGDYWTAADVYKRAGGRRYFEIEVALPLGLSLPQQIQLAREFAAAVSYMSEDPYGRLPYTFAIHDGYGHNPHFHLLLSPCLNDLWLGSPRLWPKPLIAPAPATGGTRSSLAIFLSDARQRSPEQWFARFNPDNPNAGGALKSRVITRKDWLLCLREEWESVGNRLLGFWNTGLNLDRRSSFDVGVDHIPGLHLGLPFRLGRPNPGRSARQERNLEIEAENLRRERDEERLREELTRLATRALRELEGRWRQFRVIRGRARNANQPFGGPDLDVEPLRRLWHRTAANGVSVIGPNNVPSSAPQWNRLYELVHDPAYQFAAGRWLDNDWIPGVAGPYVVWLHPKAEAMIDCGGAVWTIGSGEIEANAIATLLHCRGAESTELKGPSQWTTLVTRALQRVGIHVLVPAVNAPVPSPPAPPPTLPSRTRLRM